MTMGVNCPRCGRVTDNVPSFCIDCGTRVEAPAQAPAEAPAQAPAEAPAQAPAVQTPPGPPRKRRRMKGHEPASPEPSASRSTQRSAIRRWTRRLAVPALVAVVLFGSGVLTGWWVAGEHAAGLRAADRAALESPAADAGERAPGVVLMPDLRGMELSEARQVLADLGVDAREVRAVEQPAAGPPGLVLSQDPVYDYEVTGAVELTVSTGAVVPDPAGKDAVSYIAELQRMGAQVVSESRFAPGAEVGETIEVRPAAGRPLPAQVTVVTAAAPERVGLEELEAVESPCWSDEGTMNGQSHDSLLTCEVTAGEPEDAVYLLNRATELVTGTVGVPDSADDSERVRVEVLVDGRVAETYDVGYAEPKPVSVRTGGALRLTVRITALSSDGATAGLGSFELLGGPGMLEALGTDEQ